MVFSLPFLGAQHLQGMGHSQTCKQEVCVDTARGPESDGRVCRSARWDPLHPKPPWHQQECRGWDLLFKGLAFLFLMCSQRERKHFNSVFSKTATKSIFFPLQYHLEGAHPYTPHPFWCLKELGADMPDFGLQWYRESRHLLCLCSDVMAPWVSPGLRKQAPWLDFVLVPLFKCQSTKQISPVI